MSLTLSVTEANYLTAVRAWLLTILPNIEIVRGEANRVNLPIGPNWAMLTPILRVRLDTNADTFSTTPYAVTQTIASSWRVDVQLDCFGPSAADNAQIVAALFRDDCAVQAVLASGFDVTPLYTSDIRQLPFENAEKQYEFRHSLDLSLEVNEVITISQQFAGTLKGGIISVDEAYPPT